MNILKQFGILLGKNDNIKSDGLISVKGNKTMKQTKIKLSDFEIIDSEIPRSLNTDKYVDEQINAAINERLEIHDVVCHQLEPVKNIVPNETKQFHVSSNETKQFHVFIDGSAIGNGSKSCRAGYAAVFPNHPHLTISEPLRSNYQNVATNNRAEYMACITALEQANLEDPQCKMMLTIHTDSKLLMDSMTKWIRNWKRNNWKKSDGREVLNRDLLERLDRLLSFRRVNWIHVRAHTGGKDYNSIWNDKADEMAKEAVKK